MRRALLLLVLSCITCAPERVNPVNTWRKLVLDTAFRAEGVATVDVDRDGHLDIVTDQFWYRAPAFEPHAIRNAETFEPETQYSRNNAVFPDDLDHDGWTDIIVVAFPHDALGWFRNPRGNPNALWTWHLIAPHANMETPIYEDLFRDGRKEIVCGVESDPNETSAIKPTLAWLEPDKDPYAPWIVHPISAPGFATAERFSHGLGAGDLDGDGEIDIVTSEGWFRGPVDKPSWHPFPFHPNDCSQMYVWDVNEDGRNDVVSSSPHHFGVWWWEQTSTGFELHEIDASFSESHAMRLDDLDADGVPEIVTGKRFYSHGKNEKGALDPAVLVSYARVLDRNAPGGARFARTTIDESSGVGTQFEIADVSGDGIPDIVTSNKRGLFYFERDARCAGAPAAWVPIFDGRDLAGFYSYLPSTKRRDPKKIFRVRDGNIVVLGIDATNEDIDFGYLSTFAEYGDVRVRFRYRFTGREFEPALRTGFKLDSGFFVTTVGPDMIWPRALECQVQVDDTGDVYLFDGATFTTTVLDPSATPVIFQEGGRNYTTPSMPNPNWVPSRVVHSEKNDKTLDWNTVEIEVSGERTSYSVNDRIVMRGTGRKHPDGSPLVRGRLVLQEEGSEIWFRDVAVQGIGTPVCARR